MEVVKNYLARKKSQKNISNKFVKLASYLNLQIYSSAR